MPLFGLLCSAFPKDCSLLKPFDTTLIFLAPQAPPFDKKLLTPQSPHNLRDGFLGDYALLTQHDSLSLRDPKGAHDGAIYVRRAIMGSRSTCIHPNHCAHPAHLAFWRVPPLYRRFLKQQLGHTSSLTTVSTAQNWRRGKLRGMVINRASNRKFLNAPEVIRALRKSPLSEIFDFEPTEVYMEDKTTAEQAQLWASHHFVLLMAGGAVGNYLWLPVGAIVLEFAVSSANLSDGHAN